MPLMVFFIVILILLAALPLDAGLSLVGLRQTQNGADTAARAAAAALLSSCYNTPAPAPAIPQIIDDTLKASITGANASGTPWRAQYLVETAAGLVAGPTFDVNGGPGPPANTCGIAITVTAARNNVLSAVIGFASVAITASAAAEVHSSGGVSALAEYGRHTFHAKAVGQLQIDGNVYVASKGCDWVGMWGPLMQSDAIKSFPFYGTTNFTTGGSPPISSNHCATGIGNAGRTIIDTEIGGYKNQPGPPPNPWGEDILDTFESAPVGLAGTGIEVHGYIYSATRYPFDGGYYGAGQDLNPPSAGTGAGKTGPGPSQDINFRVHNGPNPGTIPVSSPIVDPIPALDPTLKPSAPTPPERLCPTSGSQVYTNLTEATQPNAFDLAHPGPMHLHPGTYNYPVVVGDDGTPQDYEFDGCLTASGDVYPGVYNFTQGVEICPAHGSSVTSDPAGVLLYSSDSFGGETYSGGFLQGSIDPSAGCPGVDKQSIFYTNGNFCPPGSHYDAALHTHYCYENSDQMLDAGYYGSGTYGITIGGHGTVTLNAPTSGPYQGILLYQDQDAAGNGANIGLDSYPGALSSPPSFDPKYVSSGATPGPATNESYFVDRHQPASGYPIRADGSACGPPACVQRSPAPQQRPDDAQISLTGTIHDVYAPMTGGSATQLAKMACFPNDGSDTRATGTLPQCELNGPHNPTPGASLPPTALTTTTSPALANGSNPWANNCGAVIASLQYLCHQQLDSANLWRAECSVGTPSSNAGRLQIGQTTCSNDPLEMGGYIGGGPGAHGTVTITGAAVADVFTTSGGVDATIDVQSTAWVTPISWPSP
jgi:hypothetical protein